MSAAELDGNSGHDFIPPLSVRERTMSWQAGLPTNSEPAEEQYVVRGPSVHEPGNSPRPLNIPSRQGSASYLGSAYLGSASQVNNPQGWDVHVSDPQSADDAPPHINIQTHPRRHSSTSQPNMYTNSGTRMINYDYTQASSRRQSLASNAMSPTSPNRQGSFPLNAPRQNSFGGESQGRESNTQTTNNVGGNGPTAMGAVQEDVITASPAPASATSSESLKQQPLPPSWRQRLFFTPTEPKRRRWLHILLPATVCVIGVLVGLVVYFKLRPKGTIAAAIMPTETILPQSSVLPITDSSIGAAQVVIGTYFSTAASGVLQTKLVYNDGQGRICIRTKSGNDWLNVQCLEGANPRADTPLTVLDWLGGPSIYFITADNLLSGVDHMPLNDTWKFSSLRDQNRPTHSQSQLASVTWFNGTSSWLYYQDINNQLREFGLDDYRDIAWRDGSIGPLGLALTGTGIGTARWWLLADGTEVLEVFVQVSGGALHGRVYMESVWTSDFYAVDFTPNTVSEGAALTSTVIHETNATMILLAYVSSDGFLTVQSRGTANQTETAFDAFSSPDQIFMGDGGRTTGIAAFDAGGSPVIYFVKNETVLEISAASVAATNWTTFDVTSA